MDNTVLRTAMATRLLSHTYISEMNEEAKAFHEEAAEKVRTWRNSLNLDRRIVAIGPSEEMWMWDIFQSMESAWWDLIVTQHDAIELLATVSKPKKVLQFTPDMYRFTFEWKQRNPDIDLTFVNNPSLEVFERCIRDLDEVHNIEYSVIDYDDIYSGEYGQYDFISLIAWEVVGEDELLRQIVDLLSPGAVMTIGSTNHTGKIYRDDYHAHPFYEFHEVLKGCDGYTYHVPSLYGHTVFVKH